MIDILKVILTLALVAPIAYVVSWATWTALDFCMAMFEGEI